MILTLGAVGGVSTLSFTPVIASVVVMLLTIIILSYRKVIKAYPSGGGDYEVAQKNLGEKAALIVASALLIDYVMTVAVSIASGTDNLISAFPGLDPYRIEIAVGFIIFLMAINLRGVRESGFAFAVPTYLFIASVMIMLGTGLYRMFVLGEDLSAPSSTYSVQVEHQLQATPFLLIFLLLRSFASGSAVLMSKSYPSSAHTSSTPATTSLVYQLVSTGASSPTVLVEPDARREALGFATYRRRVAASTTLALVASAT